MIEPSLVTDLTIILILVSIVSFTFRKLKQPVVLGYIIAGIIISPYTPPFSFLSEPEIISALAEIGVILLLFGIGPHFPLKKLLSLGKVSLIISGFEIPLMLILSLVTGYVLGWGKWDSLFLGAALACSSTTRARAPFSFLTYPLSRSLTRSIARAEPNEGSFIIAEINSMVQYPL